MTVLKKRKQNYSTEVITVIVSYSSFPSFYKLFQTYHYSAPADSPCPQGESLETLAGWLWQTPSCFPNLEDASTLEEPPNLL